MYELEFLRTLVLNCCEPNLMTMWTSLFYWFMWVKGGHMTIGTQLL